MISEFEAMLRQIPVLLEEYEKKLSELSLKVITERRNSQNRTIKEILGHMIDSASNNTHRIIHLQYRASPVEYPNYATEGNNDRWIAIQNYQNEDWEAMIQLWKYIHLHIIHVIQNIDKTYMSSEWIAGPGAKISLEDMALDFLPHFKLHLSEIDEIIKR